MSAERFFFIRDEGSSFAFNPVLDGIAYTAKVIWQSNRWHLFIQDYCLVPTISSPDDHDIQLVPHCKTNFIYRASSQCFEVGFPKKERRDIFKYPFTIKVNILTNLLIKDFSDSTDMLRDDNTTNFIATGEQ